MEGRPTLRLDTERLTLRDFVPGDFEALFATMQDPAYQQFYSEVEITRPFWEGLFACILTGAAAADRRMYQLAICLPDGELIGTCGVRLEDLQNYQASFGCAIGRPYWGQGFASEASRRIISYGFEALEVHRTYAETNSRNTRACRLAEALGFRLEGVLRHHRYFRQQWWDTAIYAVLRDEWPAAA